MSELTTPSYYNHPVLGETAEYVAHMPYFQGAAFKYVLRAGNKPGIPAEHDLAKAKKCLEIQLGNENNPAVMIPINLRLRLGAYQVNLAERQNHVEFTRINILREITEGLTDPLMFTYIDLLRNALKEQEPQK